MLRDSTSRCSTEIDPANAAQSPFGRIMQSQPQPPATLVNLSMIRNSLSKDFEGGRNGPNDSGGSNESRNKVSSGDHGDQQQQQHNAHRHHHHANTQSNSIGHYELKETLGKGNFSTVKLAQHKITHHSVAIKIVKWSVLTEDNLAKVNREIDVLKKLGRHKHIVRLYQVIKTKRYFFLVTEYCANGELYDIIVNKGRLKETQACKYFQQIQSAVEYLHDHNIVHRDLKAENLLLTDNHETVKIADFGFANYYKPDNPLSTWCGSPPYAAPELFNGLLYIGPPVDIWSMGVILFVLVCGSLPFDGQNLVQLKSRVTTGKFRIPFFMSTECESLIRGMLRLDPERRFGMRQIKAHCWMQKYSKDQQRESPKKGPNMVDRLDISNNRSPTRTVAGRGQSLDSDEDKMHSTDLQQSADASMTCLSNHKENGKGLLKPNTDTGSKINPSCIQSFVDTEIVNAVSNMSIDSNNSSISQNMDLTNATFSNHSGCVSSLSTSRYSTPRADSVNHSNCARQFSKESSIDDQIIDFMVDNLRVAENQTHIRQSIANERFDDLHAIYRLLKDQPELVLEAKFKMPSLPLILSSKEDNDKRPSITTGFFNFPQVNDAVLSQTKPEPTTTRASFSGGSTLRETNCQFANDHADASIVSNMASTQERQTQERLEERSWNVPPQLFLTPPIEGRPQSSKVTDASDCHNQGDQDPSMVVRSNIARHSFDSAINNKRQSECSPSRGLTREPLWDSSMLDSQAASMTPTTPVKLGDSFASTGLSEIQGYSGEPSRLVHNLANITTNLPQIDAYISTPGVLNHNLLLAQLNSAGGNAVMTQSGLLAQHEPTEQRIQQTQPLKFTPNNLVNQNYNVMNNLALQNTMKLPVGQNLSLLDPDSLSGLERRASDGQASYSSLTTNNEPPSHGTRLIDLAGEQRLQGFTADESMYSSLSNQILNSAVGEGHGPLLADQASCNNSPHYVDLFGGARFNCQNSMSSNSSGHRHSEEFSAGPLDLSNKVPTPNIGPNESSVGRRDGLKRISNQRSNSTASETAVCIQDASNSDEIAPSLDPISHVTTGNNGIPPFCHASKRAKKLH